MEKFEVRRTMYFYADVEAKTIEEALEKIAGIDPGEFPKIKGIEFDRFGDDGWIPAADDDAF